MGSLPKDIAVDRKRFHFPRDAAPPTTASPTDPGQRLAKCALYCVTARHERQDFSREASSVNQLPTDEWLTETRVRVSQLGKNCGY